MLITGTTLIVFAACFNYMGGGANAVMGGECGKAYHGLSSNETMNIRRGHDITQGHDILMIAVTVSGSCELFRCLSLSYPSISGLVTDSLKI